MTCAQKVVQTAAPNKGNFDVWSFVSKSLGERPWAQAVGAIPVAVFVVLGLLLSPYLFVIAAVALVPQVMIIVARRRHRINKSSKRITDAQVFALLRNGNRNLTVPRLARATNSSEDAARQKLNDLVVQNLLEMEAGDLEISYRYGPAADHERSNPNTR